MKFKITSILVLSMSSIAFSQDEEPAPAAPAAAAAAETPAPASAPEAPVELATVNGAKITSADVEQALRMRFGPQIDSMPAEQRAMALKQSTPQMAEELIARTLLLAAAKAAKAEADPAEVAKTVDQIKTSLPPDLSFADYAKSVGQDEAAFKATIAEELQISTHIRTRVEALPKATDEQVAKFYEDNKADFVTEESVKASHILLKTDPAAGDDGKKAKLAEIEKIRQQLIDAKGEGFAALATEHSDRPSSANGGELGDFGRGRMVPEFDKAAFSQKPGEVGEIVETQFGYHIVFVTDKTEAGQRSLDEVKEEIAESIDGEAQESHLRNYLRELEEAADITRSEALTPPAPPAPPAPAPVPSSE